MTIEDLAVKIDKRFDKVDKKIGSADKRLSRVDKKIGSVELNLTKKIEEETEFLARVTNSSFTRVENKINTVHKDLKADFSQLNKKVEAEVGRKDDIDLRIDDVATRITVLEKQVL